MSIRVRKDGTMWCAAHTKEQEGDTYIDDALHYQMSVMHGVIVALPMPEHVAHPQWWWANAAPPEAETYDRSDLAVENAHTIGMSYPLSAAPRVLGSAGPVVQSQMVVTGAGSTFKPCEKDPSRYCNCDGFYPACRQAPVPSTADGPPRPSKPIDHTPIG